MEKEWIRDGKGITRRPAVEYSGTHRGSKCPPKARVDLFSEGAAMIGVNRIANQGLFSKKVPKSNRKGMEKEWNRDGSGITWRGGNRVFWNPRGQR